jgi:hypothetical protein
MKKILVMLVMVLFSSLAFAVTEVGTWYDDLGSPEYGDSTLIIEGNNGKYFIIRKNGDGSGSRYGLEKKGNVYIKSGDRFGAKYIVTKNGLEIHDEAGYIRTAKTKLTDKKNEKVAHPK